jgi:hypothetical protein
VNRTRLFTAFQAGLIITIISILLAITNSVALDQKESAAAAIARREQNHLAEYDRDCAEEERLWGQLGTPIQNVISQPDDPSDPRHLIKSIKKLFRDREAQAARTELANQTYHFTVARNQSTRLTLWTVTGVLAFFTAALIFIHWITAPGNTNAISGNTASQ